MAMQATNVVARDLPPGRPVPSAAPPSEAGPALALAAELCAEMTAAWRRGERPPAEEFLVRLPALVADPRAALQLIHQEILLRQQFGEALADVSVLRRFPQWQAELRTLLDQQ